MSGRARRLWLPGVTAALMLAGGAAYVAMVVIPERKLDSRLPHIDVASSEAQVGASIKAAVASLRRRGESAQAWAGLAQVLHAHEMFDGALTAYENAIRHAPTDYRWIYLAALAQQKLDLTAARGRYAAAAALNPQNPAFYVNFGDLLLQLNEPLEAEQSYRRALELRQELSHAHYGLARIAVQQGDLQNARTLLEQASALSPRHGEVHTLQSQVLRRLGDVDSAQRSEVLARASLTSTRPNDPVVAAMEAKAVSSTAYARRGATLARQGDYAAAERAFRRVLDIRPGTATDYSNLGGVLVRQGRTDESISVYEKGMALAPDDVELLSNFGSALADAGDPRRGIELLERAVALDSGYWQAHQNLGLARDQSGQSELAIGHYRDAIGLNPADPGVHTNLGTSLARLGQLEAGVEAWQTALEIDPRSLEARYNSAVALVQLGRHGEALSHLREGVRLAPRSSKFLSLLAWQLATAPEGQHRDGAEALSIAQVLYQADPANPERGDLLAAALAENGRFDEAVSTLARVLTRIPSGHPLRARLEGRAQLYRQGSPFRQPG